MHRGGAVISSRGAALAIVLVASAAVWAMLAGLLASAVALHRVALRTQERAVAERVTTDLLAAWRADATAWPEAGAPVTHARGACSVQVDVVARDTERLRVAVTAKVGATLRRTTATIHAAGSP